MGSQRKRQKPSHVDTVDRIGSYRGIGLFLLALSGVINVLALTGAFYTPFTSQPENPCG
jgi:hypothetical protein